MEFIDLDIEVDATIATTLIADPILQSYRDALAARHIEPDLLVKVGRHLFNTLFRDTVASRYREQRSRLQFHQGLRIRLHCQEPNLAALPWELLYDDELSPNHFLALSLQNPVIRHLEAPNTWSALTIARPLRILFVAASPQDLPQLDIAAEQQRIVRAVAAMPRQNLMVVDYLMHATTTALQERLSQRYDILHFVGHSDLANGALCLEDENRFATLLAVDELCYLLAGRQIIAVILNTCRSIDLRGAQKVWGLGPQLVQAGIPVTIGMYGDFLDQSAITFASEFYEMLATGYPIVAAITAARQALMREVGLALPDWSQPVLFTGVRTINFANNDSKTQQKLEQMILTALLKLEIDNPSKSEKELRQQIQMMIDILSPMLIRNEIKIDVFLGSQLELVSPVSLAVVDAPTFCWKLGEEIIQAYQNLARNSSRAAMLKWQVSIRIGATVLWQSKEEQLPFAPPFDVFTEAEKERTLVCPLEIYQQLQAGQKYDWEAVVRVPVVNARRQLIYRSIRQRATFRVLARHEQDTLTLMLTSLSSAADETGETALLRGAIYESYALYDEAAQSYTQALNNGAEQIQTYARLAALYHKRAYGLLALPNEQPDTMPIALFAQRANHYNASATGRLEVNA